MFKRNRILLLSICGVCLLLSSCQAEITSVSFENFPDGTEVILDTADTSGEPYHRIKGNTYQDWGILLHSDPVDNCFAIRGSLIEDRDEMFLCLCNVAECGDASRLEIEFVEPVKSVDVGFVGVFTNYSMVVFDAAGEVIDTPIVFCEGLIDGTITHLSYDSNRSNIKKISLGPAVVTPVSSIRIRELTFER